MSTTPSSLDDPRMNDAVWARFYRDGRTLGEIAAEFGGTIYTYSPWLTAPVTRAALASTSSPQPDPQPSPQPRTQEPEVEFRQPDGSVTTSAANPPAPPAPSPPAQPDPAQPSPPSESDPAQIAALAERFRVVLRSRRVLRWLFSPDPDSVGAYGYLSSPIPSAVQQEVLEALARVALSPAPPPAPPPPPQPWRCGCGATNGPRSAVCGWCDCERCYGSQVPPPASPLPSQNVLAPPAHLDALLERIDSAVERETRNLPLKASDVTIETLRQCRAALLAQQPPAPSHPEPSHPPEFRP